MIIYIAGFAISLGPIMWLMFSEVFPLEVRGFGTSLAAATNWGFNGMVALTFLTLINLLGSASTFLIYAIITVGGIIFVITKVPETKGVSLEKIEMNLRQGIASRYLGQDEAA